jgi:hypothetical protein
MVDFRNVLFISFLLLITQVLSIKKLKSQIKSTTETGQSPRISEHWYLIVGEDSKKCLDEPADRLSISLTQWECHGQLNQRWTLVFLSDGYVLVKCLQSGRVLDVVNAGYNNGDKIQMYDYGGADNQKWKIEATGGGHFRLKAKHSGKCVDVPAFSKDNGTQLQQWDCYDSPNQKFSLLLTELR